MSLTLHILRLQPGDDLRAALAELPDQLNIDAASILSGLGSLKPAVLGGPHVHMSVSDASGAVFGGHLMAGSIVRTTAEIVVGIAPGWVFSREMDAATGYRELVVKKGS
jgi:predicted DNA-binding protein with PD1-like motif